MTISDLLHPPLDIPQIQGGDWLELPSSDPLVMYIREHIWDQPVEPGKWRVARLSQAAYLYQESDTDWSVVAKFYMVKTRDRSEFHARRELENTRRAASVNTAREDFRAVRSFGMWRGVLFLEYVDGLTLEDVIAVRRSRPGSMLPQIANVAQLLAHFHLAEPFTVESVTDFEGQVARMRKILKNLAEHGVIQDDPIVKDGMQALINRWEADAGMRSYRPTPSHGDATTTNFIFPWQGGVVAIDWERHHIADPATDLGRLMAEISHSIKQHGGSMAEALPCVDHLVASYGLHVPPGWDMQALIRRARFYQALSTLRIARNGWVARLDRLALVAQAFALLSME